MKKLLAISVCALTLCTAIRVPTSWTSPAADERQAAKTRAFDQHRPQRRPPVTLAPQELPRPLALAHGKYVRNKDSYKTIPRPHRFVPNAAHPNLIRPPNRPDPAPIENPHPQRTAHRSPAPGYDNRARPPSSPEITLVVNSRGHRIVHSSPRNAPGYNDRAPPPSSPEITPTGNFRGHSVGHGSSRNAPGYNNHARPPSSPEITPTETFRGHSIVHGSSRNAPGYNNQAQPPSSPEITPTENFRGHRIVHGSPRNVYSSTNGHNSERIHLDQPPSHPEIAPTAGLRSLEQENINARKNAQGHRGHLEQRHFQTHRSHEEDPNYSPFKPVYHFDSYFNPIPGNQENKFFDQLTFLPSPKPVDEDELAYEKRKEAVLLKNHRDDRAFEPSDGERERDHERDVERKEDEHYENEKSEEGGEVESEEEEKAPISEHEKSAEVPTRPVYPGEGKWAQRGVKHLPYVGNHQYANLEDAEGDDEKSEGHEVFDNVQDVFQRQSNRFGNNLASFPTKHKLGNYIKPSGESEAVHEDEEGDDKEELNEEEDDDEEFVPTQIYTQVRKTEDEEHLPPIYEGPHKLREVIKDSKIQTVYTEEGYEDVEYDHAGHEKEAAENEGFAEAEEEVAKEKLKKAPRYKNEPSDDSIIEESNIDHGKRVVSPNGEFIDGQRKSQKHKQEKPAFNMKNNNHFVKTEEIKTTAVKDSEGGGKEMEVLSDVKVMTMPDRDGKMMKRVVEVSRPNKYKLPKKYRQHAKKHTEQLNNDDNEELIFITSTLGPDQPDITPDTLALPTTSTEPLSKVMSKSKTTQNEVLKPTPASSTDDAILADKSKTNIRRKRFTNDFEKFEVDTAFIDDIDHSLPVKVDKTPEKYPYYFDKHLHKVNPNSALRYSEDIRNIPPKKSGEMTFYNLAHESVPCEEVETDVNPVPDRVENAEKNAKEMKQSDDVAELAESPRLKGLGDKIRCFKNRYFGENPLDSPFFKEDYVDPVTPPYNMLRFFPNQRSSFPDYTKNYPNISPALETKSKEKSLKKVSAHPKENIKPVIETVKEEDDQKDHLSENASTLSEENSNEARSSQLDFANEENEVNVDDPERILKENLTDLETFEDDYDTAAEVKEEPNANGSYDIKIPNQTHKEISEVRDKDTPTKFVLSLEKNNGNEDGKHKLDLGNVSPTQLPEIVTESIGVKIPDEVITLHPDAEFVDVEKLPEPTTTEPPLNIITTPKYTIDLVPKHIYDQIELLRFLPNQTDSTTEMSDGNEPQDVPKVEVSNEEGSGNLTNSDTAKTAVTNESSLDTKQNSRQPKTLVLDDAPPTQISDKNIEATDRSDENQPESLPLRRKNRKKLRRKRPFVVFDVNRFWPTTPFPLFQQKIKLSTIKPKHHHNSEVHYKDEIKPSEQLNVLRDVLTIIRNSSLQEPLMVAESQGSRIERPPSFSNVRIPVRSGNHRLPQHHSSVVPQKIPLNTQYNKYYFPTNFGPKPIVHLKQPQVSIDDVKYEQELSTKLKNTALAAAQNEEDEISYYTSQDIEKVRPDDKVGSSEKETSQEETSFDSTYSPSDIVPVEETYEKFPQDDKIRYVQEPVTRVLGLVPPGSDHYSTIYSHKPQQRLPTSLNPVIDDAALNKFYVEGMKPPPKNQKLFYHDLKPSKPRRRLHKPRRTRRQVKPGYTELVRSRGPQFQSPEGHQNADDDDDYVPHRPKNYHYDEKTGKIIYDDVKKEEEDDGDVEYAVVYEEVTERPAKLKTTTVSWIATAKPNDDEPPLLFFVEQLKKHPNYTLIPDPTTTEKGKGGDQTTTATTPVPLSTTPPAFLNILAKVKSDSNYKLIPDKTTAKPTKIAEGVEEEEEEEEAFEESKIENVEDSGKSEEAEKGDEDLSGLIFDISEFLPKMRPYKPRTAVDYSKYKTIERPQVNTRHNLSSRYNAESDKEFQEVNTKKIPIIQAAGGDSMESQDVSESRIEEKTSEAVPSEHAASTTVKSRRRKVQKNANEVASSTTTSTTTATATTTTTTTEVSLSSSSLAMETVTLSDDSLTATSPATDEAISSEATLGITKGTTTTSSTTSSTTATTTTQIPTTSSVKKVRIRGRIRATTPKPSSDSKENNADATKAKTTSKSEAAPDNSKSDAKKSFIRRRPQRVRSRVTTEKFFDAADVESPAKTVQRRQSQSSYYDSEEVTRQVPYRFDPVLLGDTTAPKTTQRAKIRRRPRIRIHKSNDVSSQDDEVTTYRVPVTLKETPKPERQQVRRRQRVNSRTRARNNNIVASEETTPQPYRYSQSIARDNPVSTEQPQVRGRSRFNRIESANSNARSFNKVPAEESTSQPFKYTSAVTEIGTPSSTESPHDNAALVGSSQPVISYTPKYPAYFSPDLTTPKSMEYAPFSLQSDPSKSGPPQTELDSNLGKVQNVNVDISSQNGATYYPGSPTTPATFRYTSTIDDTPVSVNPSSASNRRHDDTPVSVNPSLVSNRRHDDTPVSVNPSLVSNRRHDDTPVSVNPSLVSNTRQDDTPVSVNPSVVSNRRQDDTPVSVNPYLVSNRRHDRVDSDTVEFPPPQNSAAYPIPKDISTPQPFRYTAVIDDSSATTETTKIDYKTRDDISTGNALNGATYFPSISSTSQPFTFAASIPDNIPRIPGNVAHVQGLPGVGNIDPAHVNVSPASGPTYYPGGPTTPISLDLSSAYTPDRTANDPLFRPQQNVAQTGNGNVASYFDVNSSTQRLPYSAAATPSYIAASSPQPSTLAEPQLTATKKESSLIDIAPPSDAYFAAFVTTPLPSTIGRIIPGNVPRPTESPSTPIRRRGRIINRGETINANGAPAISAYSASGDAAAGSQEPTRARGGIPRRRPQRTRGGVSATVQQQNLHYQTTPLTIQPNVRQRILADQQPDQNVNSAAPQKVIDADARTNSEQDHPKKLNVEVYQTYDPTRKHGDNYREEDDEPAVTGTINKTSEKVILTPEGQTGNVNVGGTRNYSHRQAYLDRLKEEAAAAGTVQTPLGSRNGPTTLSPTEEDRKRANVEVYNNYDTVRKHGGNYRAEGDFPDVVQSATVSPIGRQTSPEVERIPPKKVNPETLKNIDPKHFGVYGPDALDVSEPVNVTPGPKLQRVVQAPETVHSKRVNVEAFDEYDPSHKHGGNYRKEYDDAEEIEPKSNRGRNEKLIQSPERVTPKTIHFEVFDSYSPKQRHGGNYRGEDESDITGTVGENQKAVLEPEHTQTKKVKNVEVLHQYNPEQRHGGNYKSDDEDADYEESEIVNKGNGEAVTGSDVAQPQDVNAGLFGGDERTRVPSVLMEPPKITLPQLTGIPGDSDMGTLNVEIFKPHAPAPRHHQHAQPRDDTEEINRLNVELLKPHPPAPRSNDHEDYTKKEERREETITHRPTGRPIPQRRRRPVTTTSYPEASNNFRSRNAVRRRDPKSIRGSSVANRNNEGQQSVRTQQNEQAFPNQNTHQDAQVGPTKGPDVEVFRDYDKKMKHGGNYRRADEDDIKHQEKVSSVRKAAAKETAAVRLNENIRDKPLGLYNDPKLAKNINHLKEIRIPETATEEIVRDVVEEEAEEEEKESDDDVDYGWINIKAISSTPKPVTIITTTNLPRVPNVIKDPSKRLYFYAAV